MRTRTSFLLVALLALFPLTACQDIGSLGNLGGYGTVVGEVQYVDTARGQIQLRTDAGGVRNIDYDNQTQVVFRQRNYQVSNLEPGDYVALSTRQDSQGRLYADSITVREGYRIEVIAAQLPACAAPS